MSEKHLHIVCFDVPYPVNHGGFFDLFYKLKELKRAGVQAHLHCFEYGRGRQPALDEFCSTVDYYPRQTGLKAFSFKLPYIVNSRKSEALMQRLLQDNYPILLEGIHCTWLLNDERFANRKVFVRLHNVEFKYYEQLAAAERSFFKRLYYRHESKLLKKYEAAIARKAEFLAVSEDDVADYKTYFNARVKYLPVFVGWDKVESITGKGQFCLYHGNLSVAENEKAAMWLMGNVVPYSSMPLVIAGKNPSKNLERVVHSNKNACVVANPGEQEMQDLIQKAHINILPALNSTGVKLKLLNALFVGRYCISNPTGAASSGVGECCEILTDNADMILKLINSYRSDEFTAAKIADREAVLMRIYNNEENCRKLIEWIW